MKKLIAALVAVLVAAAIAWGVVRDSDPSTATVEPGDSALVSTDGVSVTIPAGRVARAGRLSVSVTSAADAARQALSDIPAGVATPTQDRLVSVKLAGTSLTGTASIAFPAPSGLGDNIRPVVVWEDGAGGWEWLPTTWKPGDATVVATVSHFSGGFLATLDIERWAKDRAVAMGQYLQGRSGVAQPQCGDETAPRRDGVQVHSDGGDSVRWCFGLAYGNRVLKVANNRRTFTQVTFPDGWRVLNRTLPALSADALVRSLGGAMDSAGKAGTSSRIVDGGDTLELAVPAGESGQVTAELSTSSWLLSAIMFGLETHAQIGSAANKGLQSASSGQRERIVQRMIDVGGADPGWNEAMKACGLAAADNLTGEIEPSLSDTALALIKAAWDCVPSLMKADLETGGFTKIAGGIVLTAIGEATSFVLTGLHLIITGTREVYDGFASFGGASDTIYDIVVVDTADDGIDWLYETRTSADSVGPSGQRRTAMLDGQGSRRSTSFWVGCDGAAATSTFGLLNRFDQLTTTLYLDPEIVPEGLEVEVVAVLDDIPGASWQLTPGDRQSVVLGVRGVRELRLEATRTAGTCTSESVGYGIAFAAALTPIAPVGSGSAADWVGTWRGPVDQPNAREYSMILTLNEAADGTLTGTVDYPGLDCGGTVVERTSAPGRLVFFEEITRGTGCVKDGIWTLTRTSASETYASYTGYGIRATATITR